MWVKLLAFDLANGILAGWCKKVFDLLSLVQGLIQD